MSGVRKTWMLVLAFVVALAAGAGRPSAWQVLAAAQQPASLVINYVEATAARVGGNNQFTAYVMLVDAGGQPLAAPRVQSAAIRLAGSDAPAAASVSAVQSPLSTLIVFDSSGSMVGERVSAARTAAIDFVNTKRPNDQIGVILFNDSIVYSSDFTADRVAAISSVSFSPPQRTPGSCLWDTLYEAVTRARRLPAGQRAVLLVTDGTDQTRPGGPACSRRTLDDVIAHATQERARIPVYVMGLGDAQDLNPEELGRLARETGAQSAITEASGEIGGLFAGLVAALRAEFAVSAEAPAASGPQEIEISVTLEDGSQYVAIGEVEVPATVFTPPTQPPLELPTLAVAPGEAADLTPTVVSAPAATMPPATNEPPIVSIIEAQQNAEGDLVLRLNVQEGGAPVTAVIVLVDGQPIGTVPPAAFGSAITLSPGAIAEGSHTIGLEAYDTGGQVARAQLSTVLRSPGSAPAVAAQTTETPSAMFTLSAPMSPSPPTFTPVPVPTLPTPTQTAEAAVAPVEPSPAPADAPAAPPPGAGQAPTISPALIVVGVIVLAGGAVLVGLWWRSRRAGRREDAILVGGDFRYDYYGDMPPAPPGRLPAPAEPTQIYDPRVEEDRTALYVGDQARAKLEVLRSMDMEARVNSPYVVEAQRVTLGRDSTNDICFRGDRFVSAQHVRLVYVEGVWVMEELGALNKTFVNGTEVTGRVFLKDGDLIELGPYTRIRFTTEKATEPKGASASAARPRRDEDDEDLTRIHGG